MAAATVSEHKDLACNWQGLKKGTGKAKPWTEKPKK